MEIDGSGSGSCKLYDFLIRTRPYDAVAANGDGLRDREAIVHRDDFSVRQNQVRGRQLCGSEPGGAREQPNSNQSRANSHGEIIFDLEPEFLPCRWLILRSMRALELSPGPDGSTDPYAVLESGDILTLPRSFFEDAPQDREFLREVRPGHGQYHKNIAYRPVEDRISGLGDMEPDAAARVRSILRDYSRRVIEFTANLLPRYQAQWHIDYASLRPLEEAGRALPLKKRNDLLHTDAFPTRPTRGGLILRFFTNVHPTKPRVWVTSDPFAVAAARYAREAGLDSFAGGSLHHLRQALAAVGLMPKGRSRYDEFMLAFHDFLKKNTDYQQSCPKYRFEFPPGASWMVFTDVVPHSVESGQLALEQTFIIAAGSLAYPEKAPIAILEQLAGTRLA
jgi:hypothetical protein